MQEGNTKYSILNGKTEFHLGGKKFKVEHKFIVTMVDGKVCNAPWEQHLPVDAM